MPTYEYRCPEGHDFERFLKMSEATDTMMCPVHGKPATRVISGGAGLVFKGSGFYITDYGKDGKKDQQKPAAEGGASDTKSSDGKGAEAKPAGGKPADGKPADGKPADAKPAPATSNGSTQGSTKSGSGTTE
jgi:putative FmdB family regulatory protein